MVSDGRGCGRVNFTAVKLVAIQSAVRVGLDPRILTLDKRPDLKGAELYLCRVYVTCRTGLWSFAYLFFLVNRPSVL